MALFTAVFTTFFVLCVSKALAVPIPTDHRQSRALSSCKVSFTQQTGVQRKVFEDENTQCNQIATNLPTTLSLNNEASCMYKVSGFSGSDCEDSTLMSVVTRESEVTFNGNGRKPTCSFHLVNQPLRKITVKFSGGKDRDHTNSFEVANADCYSTSCSDSNGDYYPERVTVLDVDGANVEISLSDVKLFPKAGCSGDFFKPSTDGTIYPPGDIRSYRVVMVSD